MPLEDLISRFLLTYRITPHSTTGTSPAELLFSRRPRTRLDLVLPDLSGRVRANQQRQKQARDKHTKHRFFRSGDAVFVCDLPSKKDWLSGTIFRSLGTRSYLIRLLALRRTQVNPNTIPRLYLSGQIYLIRISYPQEQTLYRTGDHHRPHCEDPPECQSHQTVICSRNYRTMFLLKGEETVI